jgi:hypothetical protein
MNHDDAKIEAVRVPTSTDMEAGCTLAAVGPQKGGKTPSPPPPRPAMPSPPPPAPNKGK